MRISKDNVQRLYNLDERDDWDFGKLEEEGCLFNLDDATRIKTKREVEDLLRSTNRDGIENLIKWLNASGFFNDPASYRYHLCCEGGLAYHSLSVYKTLKELVATGLYGDIKEETMIIAAILHDVCKIGTYERKKVGKFIYNKTQTHQIWVTFEGYEVKDDFKFGHGEKSVVLLEPFIKLTKEEALMIRYHMGAFLDSDKERRNASEAMKEYPGIIALQTADITSSNVIEAKLCTESE